MNISAASQKSQLPAKTIRFYEEIGLIKPERAPNGYRDYSEDDIHCLAFLQRSRSLGFTIEECRVLLSLYEDKHRASADVKAMALRKIEEIEHKIEQLKSLQSTLSDLARNCHGDQKPNCPIIDDLAGLQTN